MLYTQTLLDHFTSPRNVGEIPDADGVGELCDPACGDSLKIWIRVEDERLTDIRFKCKGCPASIATASVLTEMAKGKHIDEATEISDDAIAKAIGGLPLEKMHCSNLGVDVLYLAVMDYVIRSLKRETTNGAGD